MLSLAEFAETAEKYSFCRSREYPTGKNHLTEFFEENHFALAALSARAKDAPLCALCGLERSGREISMVLHQPVEICGDALLDTFYSIYKLYPFSYNYNSASC